MGRVSRGARLLFILTWTIADDRGRVYAAPESLASSLFPWDTDAPGLMGGWLAELEREQCISQFEVQGTPYLAITNWTLYQKPGVR